MANFDYFMELLLAFSYLLAEKLSCSAELSIKKKVYNLTTRTPFIYRNTDFSNETEIGVVFRSQWAMDWKCGLASFYTLLHV